MNMYSVHLRISSSLLLLLSIFIIVVLLLFVSFSSSGVGRTGVFIALGIVLERYSVEGMIDLFQTVKTLRIQRSAMVQTRVRKEREGEGGRGERGEGEREGEREREREREGQLTL